MVTFSVKNIETLKSKRYPASPFQKWFHPAVEEFKATNILNLLAQLAILYLFNHDNYLSKILSLHLNIRLQIARQLPPCVYWRNWFTVLLVINVQYGLSFGWSSICTCPLKGFLCLHLNKPQSSRSCALSLWHIILIILTRLKTAKGFKISPRQAVQLSLREMRLKRSHRWWLDAWRKPHIKALPLIFQVCKPDLLVTNNQ